MNILITGSKGQLGSEIKELSKNYKNFDFIFTDYEELDITSRDDLKVFFENNTVDYIVNCAAYTAVDLAEKEEVKAFKLNAYAVKNIVEFAQKYNSKFITVSTDYVFDGQATKPYTTDFVTNPKSSYGRSKELGEKFALEYSKTVIIRTSWLYSTFGNNFVKTMLRLGKERDELGIVSDQIGSPTYAKDLAKAILDIIKFSEKDKFIPGIYHYANKGAISWYDFTKKIFEIENINCKLNAITTADYPTPAKRPAYSVFDTSKIAETYNADIPNWDISLKECLSRVCL